MRLRLFKPLHGWRAFVSEISIIVIGVLVALGAQQLVEDWNWTRRVTDAERALQRESRTNAQHAVEMIGVAPCVDAQLDPTEVWEAAVNDGTIQRLEPPVRRQLASHYTMLASIRNMAWANNQTEQGLSALAHPLPLDPAVRYSVVKEIEQLRGRLEFLDILNGQIIVYLQKAGMLPPAKEARALTERYGTYRFCKAQGLPMRSFAQAMTAVPN